MCKSHIIARPEVKKNDYTDLSTHCQVILSKILRDAQRATTQRVKMLHRGAYHAYF